MARWARGGRRGHIGPLAAAWAALPDSIGETDMAVSGSVTTAYTCRVVDEIKLTTQHTPRLRTECATVDDAAQRLASFGIG